MLPEFYRNESLRKEVHAYLVAFLSEKAIEKVFAREDVSAVAEAKEMIDGAFDNLTILFHKHKQKESVEEAV